MQYFVSDLLFRKASARRVQSPRHISPMQISAVPRIPLKLNEGSYRLFGIGRTCRRPCGAGLLRQRFHFLEKFARCCVSPDRFDDWRELPSPPLAPAPH
jgi:hypothetical protein